MQLSPHFSLHDLTFSATAARRGWDNSPTGEALDYLKALANDVLEPLRVALDDTIIINSGYRCSLVNVAAHGAEHSAHLDGRAADIHATHHTPLEVCRMAYALALPVSQITNEFDEWTHISIPWHGAAPSRQCLRSARTPSGIIYSKGFE